MHFPVSAATDLLAAAIVGLLFFPMASAAASAETGREAAIPLLHAREIRRFSAPDAFQGAAVDADAFYAISNTRLTKYDKTTGRRLANWSDRSGAIVHLNSCAVRKDLLFCAESNFPTTPATSSVEVFDTATLKHVGHHGLGTRPGALTWVDWHDGAWWLCYAIYGGRRSKDGLSTMVIRYDKQWRRQQAWRFPASVLGAFGAMSASGGAWGPDGYLYVTGHDRTELYVLRLPGSGSVLRHVATVTVPGHGQAFGWDSSEPRTLYSIDRPRREVVVVRVPPIPD